MLGFVLGTVFERNLFISTEIYGWTWLYRPAVLVILAVTLWVVAGPLRDNLRDVVRCFRSHYGPRLLVSPYAAINAALPASSLAALWQASAWPWQSKLVPD